MSLERFTRKPLATLGPDALVTDAAALMEARHVGAVVIVDQDRPVGILTDRDLALRVVGARRRPETTVAEVMSRELIVVQVGARIDEALFTMRRAGVRRLPLVDGAGRLAGVVALDDLLVLLSAELSSGIEAVLDNRGP